MSTTDIAVSDAIEGVIVNEAFEQADTYLRTYRWDDDSKRYQGTEDWEYVAGAEEDDLCYEWDEIHVFYSPSARRSFWSSGSGCSCNGWGEGLSSAADFENGDKDAALRALDEWRAGYHGGAPHKNKVGPADRAMDDVRAHARAQKGC